MIQITDNSKCCGCEACVQVCPKHCIRFTQDHEGFFYPEADADTCIQCGLCEKVCPVLHPYDEQKPQEVLAAINKDEDIRMASSSGGVFTLLAEHVIQHGGVVFGVRFDEQWQVVFDYAESIDKLSTFRGSKYLQAHVGQSFIKCKKFLDKGRMVLFSGTPCQIAGLNLFLRKSYSNLLTVDFICHGTPSPKVWQHYLTEAVKVKCQNITDIKFRDKHLGWKNFSITISFLRRQKMHTITSAFSDDLFMQAFLANLILRPSCHFCPSKSGRSHSDITIADFWGVDQVIPKMFDDRGTSLVLINTKKGHQSLTRKYINWTTARYDDALRFNSAITNPATCHPMRNAFFLAFNDQTNLHSLISKILYSSFKVRAKITLKRICKKILINKTNVFTKYF